MTHKDAERGAALVERICRLSQTEFYTTDTCFGHAVRRVGHAMAASGEDYLSAGADLAEYLLSDRPIGKGERRELAMLVLGECRPAPNRPRTAHPSNPRVLEIVDAFRAELARPGAVKKNVTADISSRFGIDVRTLRKYRKMIEDREKALERNKSPEA